MNTFWTGFTKLAAILSKMDAQGGVAPRSPEEIQGAQNADLLTLPKNIEGANCGNCRFIKVLDKESGMGMCQNPEVMQEVTPRMVCSFWDGLGSLRNWEAMDAAEVVPGQEQLDEQGNPVEGGDMGGTPEGFEGGQGGMTGDMNAEQLNPTADNTAEAPPAKEKKEPKADKKESGHHINISVNGGKEKKAALRRFMELYRGVK